MSGYIKGKINTKQYSLIPTCYDEMISEDNPVRVLEVCQWGRRFLTQNMIAKQKTQTKGLSHCLPLSVIILLLFSNKKF